MFALFTEKHATVALTLPCFPPSLCSAAEGYLPPSHLSKPAARLYAGQLRSVCRPPVCLTWRHGCTQVMLLGDTGVGKTCIMIKFKDGHFLSGTYISTVGIDYRVSQYLQGLLIDQRFLAFLS